MVAQRLPGPVREVGVSDALGQVGGGSVCVRVSESESESVRVSE